MTLALTLTLTLALTLTPTPGANPGGLHERGGPTSPLYLPYISPISPLTQADCTSAAGQELCHNQHVHAFPSVKVSSQ